MELDPTFNGIAMLALPDKVVVPFTVIVAPPCITVAVTVVDTTSLETEKLYRYVLVENTGIKVPALSESAERVASLLSVTKLPLEQ